MSDNRPAALCLTDVLIRPESRADQPVTEHLIREAFWNHYSPGCSEHYLLHIMRTCPALVPGLNLVAEVQGTLAGSSVCLEAVIHGDDGQDHQVLSLGPIAVLPQYQKLGIGGLLIRATKQLARQMGYRAIFLCGDPAYYSRQGFSPAKQYDIRTAGDQYMAALQVCELYSQALSGITGRYEEDPIYAACEPVPEEYEASFPAKEKIAGTPSQKRFLEIASMVEERRTNP